MQYIFFDVDGVLVRGFHYLEEYRINWDRDLEQDLGINREAFAKHFFHNDLFAQALTGQSDLTEVLSSVLVALNSKVKAQDFIQYWLEKDSNLNQELFAVIDKLIQNPEVKLYIATNQTHERAKYLMEDLELKKYFLDIFHSAKIGHTKHESEYFDIVNRELNISACKNPPIFFDDTPSVVEMAKNNGWDAFQFRDCESLRQSEFIRTYL